MTTAGGSLRLGRQEIHLSFLKLFSLVVRISWFTYCLHIYCTNNSFPRLFHSKYKASHRHSARTGTSLVLRRIFFLTPSPPDTLDRDPRLPYLEGAFKYNIEGRKNIALLSKHAVFAEHDSSDAEFPLIYQTPQVKNKTDWV